MRFSGPGRLVFRHSFAIALVYLVAVVATTQATHAQVLYGSLTGNVSDSSDAQLPGANVEALNTATGISKQATTNNRGAFQFNDLQPGVYKVTISAPAFSTVIQEGVAVDANTVRRLDARLQVSQITESVTVAASAVTLQTDRADINAQLPKSQISNIPMGATRNFQSLYKLIPGFSPPANAHSDAGNPQRSMVSNVNGVSQSNNTTRLDGATISYPWLPHITAYLPPAEAVETVNIVTNSFDAEQGMAGGAAINAQIKSGTNEFHGDLWEYHTNSALKARNYFFVEDNNPKNILNQFGAAVGGPIVKNKLFFFADWERTMRRQYVSAFRTVPTEALRRGDFNGTGAKIYDPTTGNPNGSGRQLFENNQIPVDQLDPAAQKMISLFPQPNLNTFPNNYFATGTYQFNRDNADIKVNYNPTSKMALFGRYSISPSDIFDPPSLGEAGGDALGGGQPGSAPGRVQSAGAGITYTITPTLLFDGNIGFTRQRLGAENVDIDQNYGLDFLNIPGTNGPDRLQGGFPRFTVDGFSSFGNPNVSNPFLFRDNQYVGVGNLSWIKGSHSFRFGGEYTYYEINHFQPETGNGPRGGFNFRGGVTSLNGGTAPNLYNSWAAFLLGLPQEMGKSVQYINPSTVRMPSFGFYARDQWQVTPKLTINYGLRYEYYPFAKRSGRGGDRYDPATNQVYLGGLGGVPNNAGVDVGKGQIAPRFGIAYRMNDKTVVRAGYGISIDPNSFRVMRNSYPATIASQITGENSYQPAGSLQTGIPAIVGPDLDPGIIPISPTIATTTFPTEFNRGYIQSYNLTVQRDLGAGFNLQAGYVGTRAIRQTNYVNINASAPGGGNNGRPLAQQFGRTADTTMLIPFNTANYDALQTQLIHRMADSQFGVVYTFSKSINYGDNSDSGLTWNTPAYWDRNRAVAGFDRTHNLQIYGIYELPFGRGKRWAQQGWASVIAGGWQLSGTLSRMSGLPFTVLSNGASVNAPGNTQTADQVVSDVKILGNYGPGQSYFDPYAFAPVTDVRFGNSGRNILRGPGLFNLDAGLFRNFQITERFRLQFRAEAFGLTNTPQFDIPSEANRNVSNASRAADGTITALNNFSSITTAGGERQIRFALKVSF